MIVENQAGFTTNLLDGSAFFRAHNADLCYFANGIQMPAPNPLIIPPNSVDLVVTSPPYKKKDGYSKDLILAMGTLIRRVLKPGGWAFVNFGQLSEEMDRPFIVQQALKHQGLTPHQTFIWIKSVVIDGKQRGHYTPINSNSIANYCHEMVFSFYKEPKPSFDRLSIGVEFSDKSNLTRGTRASNGDVHCAGDVWIEGEAGLDDAWFLKYKTTGQKTKKTTSEAAHAYEYPEELVERCIRLSGVKPGATVLDCCLGSGTTAVVAKRYGLNAIGIEIDQATLNGAVERWKRT